MAAGLGTRLRPLTYEVPKPMVPVANRPIMEHVLRLVAGHGMREVIANLHWFPETIRGHFGDGGSLGIDLTYSQEETLLGTAGGVRNVRDWFGSDPFLVMAADPLTDVDLSALAEAHRANGGIATLAVKQVPNVTEYGVVITGADHRVQGFQEKPDPAEALSNLASCMIYVLEPEIFDYFPERPVVDFATEVFPALLEHDVPFHVHETDAYWNDVGSIPEYLSGNLDVLSGAVEVEADGELVAGGEAPEDESPGRFGSVLVGADAEIAGDTRLEGPLVIGPGARVGSGAIVKESVLLPGAEVPAKAMVVGSIIGRRSVFAGG